MQCSAVYWAGGGEFKHRVKLWKRDIFKARSGGQKKKKKDKKRQKPQR